MTRFVDAVHQDWWLDDFSELIRARQRVMQVASGRWADWPASSPLVDVWVRWRDEPILSAAAMRREVQVWWGIHHDYRPNEIAAILGDHANFPWFTTVAVRRGRADGLHACLDLIAVLAATTADNPRHDAARQLITQSHQVSRGWRRDLLDPAGTVLSLTGNALEEVLRGHARQRIQAALLVALIRREPIPVDPTDPAGKPLRRYERNGELIGYYACGDDGVDNGGTREDWQFPFDRPWDPPAAP
jgi:hypothetical protein